ncbi:MAG: rRNA maturation RNase YbeY, partial [Bacteroidota bacterium]
GFQLAGINYIFCSDPYLLALNRTHLDHDYFTDILTFPYHEPGAIALAADIYISIDRVGENADSFHTGFDNELHRVMIHGLLHLMGYDDHDEAERQAMRQAEEKALAQRAFA